MYKLTFLAAMALSGQAAFAQDIPKDQVAFKSAITAAREAYEEAANDLAKGSQRPKRGTAICEAVPDRAIENWSGTVYELSTNGDGWGVFSVELDGDIWVSTWNNSFSDISYGTLIDPASQLFSQLAVLEEGQEVIFSGSFFQDEELVDCFAEKSMTMRGSIEQPEFVFAFTSVLPLGQ